METTAYIPMMASWFGACLRSEDLLPRHVGASILNSVIIVLCVYYVEALFTFYFKRERLWPQYLIMQCYVLKGLDPTVSDASAYRKSLALNLQGCISTRIYLFFFSFFFRAGYVIHSRISRHGSIASPFMHVLAIVFCGMHTPTSKCEVAQRHEISIYKVWRYTFRRRQRRRGFAPNARLLGRSY